MTKPSITMAVKKGVTVVRDGKRVRPEVGKTFDFTADERDSILNVDPAALAKPAGEDEGTAATASTSAKTTTTTTSNAESSQSKARGGKKAATANTTEGTAEGEGEGEGADTGDDDL